MKLAEQAAAAKAAQEAALRVAADQAQAAFAKGLGMGAVDVEQLEKGASRLASKTSLALLNGSLLPKDAKGTRVVETCSRILGIEPRFKGDADDAVAEAEKAEAKAKKPRKAAAKANGEQARPAAPAPAAPAAE